MPPPPPGPPPGPFPPAPLSPQDARLWAMLAHLSGLFLAVIGPLVVMLALGPRSEFTKDQATEALNFQITVLIASVISALLTLVLIGFALLLVVGIGALILIVIASVQSYGGAAYRYPVTIRFVK